MKKLLTIICGGVVCTAMVQGGVIGCVNPDRDLVLRTLKNFGRNNPLKIEWVRKKVKASEPDVSKKIRGALIEHGVPKQIAEMAPDISFGKEVLKPGQAVAVTATYKCKKVSIFVQEESQKAGVLRALKQLSDKQPVTIDWVGDNAKASDPLVSKAIRDWLQKHDTTGKLTAEVTGGITFGAQALQIEKAVSVTATYEGTGVSIFVREKAESQKVGVLRALKQFSDKQPVTIDWVGDNAKASDPLVSKAIRDWLQKHDTTGKLTAEVTGGITFGAQALQIEKAVSVTATYEGTGVSIFVREKAESQKAGVLRALKQFSDKQPVTIDWVGDNAKASDPLVSKAIRDWLQKHDTTGKLTAEVTGGITFGAQALQIEKAVSVTATYEGTGVSIFVREKAESQKAGVLRALKQFSDKQPVTIDWVGDNAKASDPLVSKAIRDWLQKHDTTGKLTAEVTGGITFGAQALQIEKAVSVTATYEGEEVEIAVWEWAKAPEEEVLQELTKFDAEHPLEVDVVDKQHPKIKASNQNATRVLREAIKKEDDKGIFTNEILKEISFGDEFIEEGKTTKITANYEQKKVEIYVEETESPIITILGKIFTRKNPLRVNVKTHDLGGFDAELYINGITIAIIRESQGRVSAALLYNIKFSGKARWGRISEYTVHSGNLSGTLFILPRFPA